MFVLFGLACFLLVWCLGQPSCVCLLCYARDTVHQHQTCEQTLQDILAASVRYSIVVP
jgi:hypothetical protein